MSAPSEKKVVVSVLPAVWSVKLPMKVPDPAHAASEQVPLPGVQPRTLTDLE
jgi:hypothetical protein